jgi:hypothetical protein
LVHRLFHRPLVPWCLGVLLAASGAAQESAEWVDAEVWLVEGVAALQQERNQDAVDSFRSCLSLDPQEGTCRYFLGIGLLRLGKAAEAAVEIEASQRSARPPRVDRERVLADLRTAQGVAKESPEPSARAIDVAEWQPRPPAPDPRPRFEGRASLAAGVDSNPTLLSEDFRLPLPSGGLVDGSESEALTALGLRASYHPDLHSRWSPGLRVEVRQSLHRSLQDLDLGQATLAAHLAYGRDPRGSLEGPFGPDRAPLGDSPFTFLLQGDATDYRLGGKPYLSTLGVAVSLSWMASIRAATGLAASWQDRSFSHDLTASRRQSGRDLRFGIDQTFFLGTVDRSVRLELSQLDRTAGRAEALSRLEVSGVAELPFASRWDLHLRAAWQRDRFDHPESQLFFTTGTPRKDETWRGFAELGWSAQGRRSESPRYRLFVRGSWTDRDSSVDLGPGLPDLGYRRTTASLGWEWRF